jgi:hypothetical protein
MKAKNTRKANIVSSFLGYPIPDIALLFIDLLLVHEVTAAPATSPTQLHCQLQYIPNLPTFHEKFDSVQGLARA